MVLFDVLVELVRMSRPIDKEFEDADDTGVLDISGRNLRQFPVIPGELMDFHYIFEAGGCGLRPISACTCSNVYVCVRTCR